MDLAKEIREDPKAAMEKLKAASKEKFEEIQELAGEKLDEAKKKATKLYTENVSQETRDKISKGIDTVTNAAKTAAAATGKVIDEHTLKMRVWERGSGETLACGTGACAAAVAACLNGYCKKGEDIKVILRGGELIIRYTDEAVYMTGNCEKVFTGSIEI